MLGGESLQESSEAKVTYRMGSRVLEAEGRVYWNAAALRAAMSFAVVGADRSLTIVERQLVEAIVG